jgi:hypothetical protein
VDFKLEVEGKLHAPTTLSSATTEYAFRYAPETFGCDVEEENLYLRREIKGRLYTPLPVSMFTQGD